MIIRIIFDNYSALKTWRYGWGFSALVGKELLIDTGSDPEDFLANLNRTVDPGEIKQVVISHPHWDHTGGLFSLVNRNSNLEIFVGEGFSRKFQQELKNKGARVRRGGGWRKISKNIWIGPELKSPVPEQFLVIEKTEMVILIAGCSHPGIDIFAKMTAEKFKKPIWILGGFHLFSSPEKRIIEVAENLRNAGVIKAYPSHCSGESTFNIFSKYFPVESAGSGKEIEF